MLDAVILVQFYISSKFSYFLNFANLLFVCLFVGKCYGVFVGMLVSVLRYDSMCVCVWMWVCVCEKGR